MIITLNWVVGSGATSQDIQYKAATSSTWITFSSVSGVAITETVTGLPDNIIYDFRIGSQCTGGTMNYSTPIQAINITEPPLTDSPTSVAIGYSFPELGGSVTSYVVKIYDSLGTTELSSQTPTGATTRSGTFSGLTPSTTYNIRIIPTAGSFTKTDLPFNVVSTTAPPSCPAPTGVSAVLGV